MATSTWPSPFHFPTYPAPPSGFSVWLMLPALRILPPSTPLYSHTILHPVILYVLVQTISILSDPLWLTPPFYSSSSTHLFILNSINSWHSHQTYQTLHLKNIHFHTLSNYHTPCLCPTQRRWYNYFFFCISTTCMHKSSNQMRFVHFADVTTVFASDSDINDVHATVNRELVGVDNWR